MAKTSFLSRGVAAAERGRQRARFRGEVAGNKLWSDEEISTLKAYYPAYDVLLGKLKGRTYLAIRAKVLGLGIQKKRHLWTAGDLSRLRKLYFIRASAGDLRNAFPTRTLAQIKDCAKYYGIRRPRARLKSTGIPVIDDIRERAFDIGYSMVDLDKEAGTRTYFQKAVWHQPGGVQVRPIARGVKALGGILRAQWTESLE